MTERLAFSKTEAAQSLGVEIRWFNENVLPALRVVRRGRKCLVPRMELERWLEANAALTLEEYKRELTRAAVRAFDGGNRVVA